MDFPKEITYLWGAACLVALFGIWWVLWSRLGTSSNPSSPKMSKKERAALEEQQRIEAAAQRMLEQMGMGTKGDGHQTGDIPAPTHQPTAAEAIKLKYSKKRGE